LRHRWKTKSPSALRAGGPFCCQLPTVGDFLPGFEQSAFLGIGAAWSTPPAIVERLNREINGGLADPRIKTRLAEVAGTTLPGSPADCGRLIAAETEKWGKVIKIVEIS
jgi:tripartite-type tricarboxylate transporter receptor subunit TctC